MLDRGRGTVFPDANGSLPMTRLCPNCQQVNPADALFCLNCSSRLPSAAADPFQQPQPGSNPFQQQQAGQIPPQQPRGGAAQYGAPPPGPGGSGSRATIAIVLGIAALLCCGGVTGIPAAILGWIELNAINAGTAPPDGKTMATAALWLGIAATIGHAVLWVLLLLTGMLTPMDY